MALSIFPKSFLTTSTSAFFTSDWILLKIVLAAVKGVPSPKLMSTQSFFPFTRFSGSFASSVKVSPALSFASNRDISFSRVSLILVFSLKPSFWFTMIPCAMSMFSRSLMSPVSSLIPSPALRNLSFSC
ncbi:hypothetical protein D3C86_1357550 [compost metagenome]